MMTVNPDEFLATAAVKVSTTQNTLEHLLAETGQYLTPKDLEKIQRAYELANRAHMGVKRKSGEPYILHPLEVALLLADMRIDADGIVAALLHDVVEDTTYSLDELREQFGTEVANIVDGVTKFDMLIPDTSHDAAQKSDTTNTASHGSETAIEQRQSIVLDKEAKRRQGSETVRKMFLAMAEDPRVVVLKLADRLHNMRTLNVMNPVQQQNKARETREIYAPLAQRLGMVRVQAELEDLAFSYVEPEKFTRLAREVEEERRKRQPYVDEICRILQEEMDHAGIHAQVHAWQKHLASIYRKLQQSGGDVSQIHDLVSFRILVDSDHDCYLALGHIHALWRPKDGRIKDFIATPKLNGYQSLHTTVFCLENRLAEIQIRTPDMQRTADYGIASYWYLKSRSGSRLSYHEMIAWIEQLRDWQRELPQSADEFVEAVKGDMFQEQIFVFTPKGEVKDLPRGSTPLDMAYRIHTDIGDHCAGARIITNMADTGRLVTRLVPLDYELQGGEIVDIVVNRTAHPTRDWLSFARTTAARTKIRRYLKTYEREINLQLGRERLDLALKTIGVQGIGAVRDEDITILRNAASTEKPVFKKYHTLDDVYVAIGHEDLPVEAVVEQLLPHMQSRGDLLPLLIPSKQERTKATLDSAEQDENGHGQNGHAIQMELPTLMQAAIKLAHCCCPIPGDAIVGFLNPNKGLFVHRSDCRTLRRSREQAQERCVDVNWHQIEAQKYLAPITITAHDRAGLLRDVAAVVSDSGINMTAVSSNTTTSLQKAVITATLEIETVEQLERLFKRLLQVKNVVSVSRSLGRRVG
ncbi:MAG TPA: bifunctional (p)ppGpp synthetase/guanosine-3',5'-bis(diphosphate) 3'-pyrophosphohydrolase [Ktedonobacteraceae bacterium]|nr:bifunctional (p)ppGpp synthetase/guanosine-3',5'-bis(diphosphate) 3'-pyrophosphohydrolase [Ktedonobacteraceae bacterium]